MATIKQLIDKNKVAYESQFYVESIHLSYILIIRALKQITNEEKISVHNTHAKLNEFTKKLKSHYSKAPLFKKKLKKEIYRHIVQFNSDYKLVTKELKFQYPEIKLRNTARSGIQIIIKLNTTLIKLKNNKL